MRDPAVCWQRLNIAFGLLLLANHAARYTHQTARPQVNVIILAIKSRQISFKIMTDPVEGRAQDLKPIVFNAQQLVLFCTGLSRLKN